MCTHIVMYNVRTYCNVPDSLRVNILSLSDAIPPPATHVGPLKKCLRPQSSEFHYFSFNFCPSSKRTSHILAIVCHFIALFEPMLVGKGSRLFALITFCWHFQFLSWFVPPPQAHLPTCLICGLFCPETCPRHGKQNYPDLPPLWTKWKNKASPNRKSAYISLMTTLAEKAGWVSFSGQYCKWNVASVAGRGSKTWVA